MHGAGVTDLGEQHGAVLVDIAGGEQRVGARERGIAAHGEVLDAQVLAGRRVGLGIGGRGRRVLFGHVGFEGDLLAERVDRQVGRRCEVERRIDRGGDAAVAQQIAEVRRVRLDGIAVAAVGGEVQRDDRDGGGRAGDDGAVLHACGDVVAVEIVERDAAHAVAGGAGIVIGDAHAAELREAAIAGRQTGAVGEDVEQALRRGVEHHQLVVEAQRVLDIELRDIAGRARLDRVGELVAVLVDRADGGADAAAVLQRDHHRHAGPERLQRHIGIGVGGDVAEVGFLCAGEHPVALEIGAGEAELHRVLGGDDRVDGAGDALHRGAGGAAGDDGRGRFGRAVNGLQRRLIGGIGAVGVGIERAGIDMAEVIESDLQAAEIAELGVGGDDQGRRPVGPGGDDRIGAGEIGGVAVEGARRVGRIAEPLVAATGDHDVDAVHQRRQRLVAGDGVELIDHDDLVDAGRGQRVDGGLHVGGDFLDVGGGGIAVVLHHRAVRRGLGQQVIGGGADNADLHPVHGDDGVGRDLALDGRGFLPGEGIGSAAAEGRVRDAHERAVGGEIEVVGDEGELRADPGARRLERAGDAAGAEVELVVAQRRGIDAERVHDRDIRPAERGCADHRVQRGIGAADQPGPGDPGVALGEGERVGAGRPEVVDHGADDGRGVGAERAGFTVEMQNLQRVAHDFSPRGDLRGRN